MVIRVSIVLIFVMFLCGCSGDQRTANKNQANSNSSTPQVTIPPPLTPEGRLDVNFKACNPYFPLVPGSVAKYVIHYSSGLTADLTVVVDAAEENGRTVFKQRSQILDRSGGMEIVQSTTRKLVCDGERILILSETNESNVAGNQTTSEFVFRENAMIMPDSQTLARKGSTWSYAFRSTFRTAQGEAKPDTPTIVSSEVGDVEQVSTPVGSFKALLVTRKVNENETYDYFAPGIGLVRRNSKEGTFWELREFSGLKALE